MKIVSWNVNGLRACTRKGFGGWLAGCDADVVGLQEVRALPEQLPSEIAAPAGWSAAFSPAERLGYSGVGLYSRRAPDSVETSLGAARYDREGRVQIARFGRLTVVNCYFPNGSGRDRDHSRVPYKLAFYRRLYKQLNRSKIDGAPIVVMGDFNTAHRPIDLARPAANKKTSGFLPVEREELDRWLRGRWVDSFRRYEPGGGHYTWWAQRGGCRARNVGWRIDLALLSPGALPYLRGAATHPEVAGSDHCPISVTLDDSVLSG